MLSLWLHNESIHLGVIDSAFPGGGRAAHCTRRTKMSGKIEEKSTKIRTNQGNILIVSTRG